MCTRKQHTTRFKHTLADLEGDDIVLLEILVDASVQLAEGGKTSRSHPHNEVLVLHTCPERYRKQVHSRLSI